MEITGIPKNETHLSQNQIDEEVAQKIFAMLRWLCLVDVISQGLMVYLIDNTASRRTGIPHDVIDENMSISNACLNGDYAHKPTVEETARQEAIEYEEHTGILY